MHARALFLPCLGLALLAAGCPGRSPHEAPPTSTPAPARDTTTFVFAASGDAVGLDPGHVDDGESIKVLESIFDTLTQFKPGTSEVIPGLAESWTASPDGLEWTFTLRPGVTFHDGTPVNADAVLFSLLRQHDPAHEMHGVGGAWQYWSGMDMSNIVDTITKVDDLTVAMKLKKPEAPFLANLAMPFASIVSPTAARAAGEAFPRKPVGSGPFRFSRWDVEQRIVLEANPSYWGGAPKLERVIFEVVKDKNVRSLRFQSGEIHAFDNPGPSELQAVREMPHAKVLQQPGMNVGYLAMNCDRKPFGDTRVRLAVNHAIHRQRILDGIYKGTGQIAKNPLPPSLWGHADDVEDFAYDPARAKQLLAEAGLPNGFTCSLWYMPVARPYMPDGKKVAEAIQLDLKEVGITAELVTYDWSVYLEKTKRGEHDMALLGWSGDNGDPDNFLNVLLSIPATTIPAQNISFWRNVEFNDLIQKAKTVTDQAERAELYRKAQHVFHADPPWVCLAHNLQTVVLRDDVEGWVLYPSTRKDFRSVSLGGGAGAAP